MNCWEMVDCKVKDNCPAYPDHGKHCARVAGTLCQGKEQVMMSHKIEGCNQCSFYQSEHYDFSFKGFIRMNTDRRNQKIQEKNILSDAVTLEEEIYILLDLYQSGAVDKKNFAKQITPLFESRGYVAENV